MNRKILRDLLDRIESKYKSSKTRIATGFARELISETYTEARRTLPPDRRAPVDEFLSGLYSRVNKGMTAGDFHRELNNLWRRFGSEGMSPDSEGGIARLERQLRELENIVTSPGDIEKRFGDLQRQVEGLRGELDGAGTLNGEKQEDMLQKFLGAEKRAFIIMPFDRDFDNVWLGGIKPACMESHYAPLRLDEVNLSSLITEDIEKYSRMSDVAVVDLTGNNPNVMFELGWSLAKNKKPIVLCQGEHSSKVAFDVRGIRHISYQNSWLGIEELKKKLKDFISSTEKQVKSAQRTKKQVKKATQAATST